MELGRFSRLIDQGSRFGSRDPHHADSQLGECFTSIGNCRTFDLPSGLLGQAVVANALAGVDRQDQEYVAGERSPPPAPVVSVVELVRVDGGGNAQNHHDHEYSDLDDSSNGIDPVDPAPPVAEGGAATTDHGAGGSDHADSESSGHEPPLEGVGHSHLGDLATEK